MTDEEKRQKKIEDDAAAVAAAAAADGAPDGAEVQMTQANLDKIIDNSFKRGAKNSADAKKMKSATDALAAAEARIVEFEAAATKAADSGDSEASAAEIAKRDQLIEQLKTSVADGQAAVTAEKEARTGEVASLREKDLRAQVVTVAAAAALNAEDVFVLMQAEGLFKQDEEGNWLVQRDGKIQYDIDEGGDPLSIKKAVAQYLDGKPHLKRGSGRTGSGPGGGAPSDSDNTVADLDTANMSPTEIFQNKDKILRTLGVAQRG